MAIMIPESIEHIQEATDGEKKVYKLLKSLLPNDHIVFYNIRVKDIYPDFIILSPDLGLIVLEVKDWLLHSIKSANIQRYDHKKEGKVKNPLEQAKKYTFTIVNSLKKDKNFVQSEGKYQGNLMFTYGYGVVFTNILKKNFVNSHLNNSIKNDFIVFKDDLETINENDLRFKLEKMLPIKFDFSRLNNDIMERLKDFFIKERYNPSLKKENKDVVEKESNKKKKYIFATLIILIVGFVGFYVFISNDDMEIAQKSEEHLIEELNEEKSIEEKSINEELDVGGSVNLKEPYQKTTIKVHVVVKDKGVPVEGAKVKIKNHYRTTISTFEGTTDKNGEAVIPFNIGGASIGYEVQVEIVATYGEKEGKSYTSFTPKASNG